VNNNPDWEALVQELASRNPIVAQMVKEAQEQSAALEGTPEFHEAVHTLVRQRMQMTAEVQHDPSDV